MASLFIQLCRQRKLGGYLWVNAFLLLPTSNPSSTPDSFISEIHSRPNQFPSPLLPPFSTLTAPQPRLPDCSPWLHSCSFIAQQPLEGSSKTYIMSYFFLFKNLSSGFLLHLFIYFQQTDVYLFISLCQFVSCGLWTLSCGMWDLVPWPGIEPGNPALGVQILSPWTTREVHFLLHLEQNSSSLV